MTMTFDHSLSLRDGMRHAHWRNEDLWVASVALGGNLAQRDVERITSGDVTPSAHEYDVLAAALNDHFIDVGIVNPVRYSDAV